MFLHTGFGRGGRPSFGSWVVYGLGSEKRGSAGVRRDAFRAGRRRGNEPVVDRLFAERLPGNPVPLERRPGAVSLEPQGSLRRRPPPRSRYDLRIESSSTGRRRRPGNCHAHQPVRDGVPDANVGAGADGPVRRNAGDARSVRGQAGKGVVRQQLPAGPAAGRARRADDPAL